MKKPFIYSAIAFVLFLFGCEEEYDKSGIYSVDIVTMNKTDAYAVVDYRTLCGSGRLDTVPPHSKTVNKILDLGYTFGHRFYVVGVGATF